MLFFLVTPSSAGQCYVIHDNKPKVGGAYQILPKGGAARTWENTLEQLNGDTFTISFNQKGELNMNASQKRAPHRYVIIFQYQPNSPGTDIWLWLNNGDGCSGVANGDKVPIPPVVRVAQINGS